MNIITESQEEPKIAPIFLTNKISATMIIPIQTARRYGLDKPAHVVVEEMEEGILIRKLKLEEVETGMNKHQKQSAGQVTNPRPADNASFNPTKANLHEKEGHT